MQTDESAVIAECKAAQVQGQEISDGTARTIASWYYDGQGSRGYAFVSTGAIEDPTQLWRELGSAYDEKDETDRLALDMLGTYLINAGRRGPQKGWADKWVR